MANMTGLLICVLALSITIPIQGQANDRVTFEDSPPEERSESDGAPIFAEPERSEGGQVRNRTREGKDLFDWIGLGTGQRVDPYMARTNQACLKGDLSECFKSRALNVFSEFFDQPEYKLNDNIKVVRMSRDIVQHVNRQPYEYVGTARGEESEWDQLVKFASRKVEKFVKTVGLEVDVPSWAAGENDVYAPRFLDEISEELDTLENKKDTLFSRNRLRRLFIPMLIILKLFKLKLLLFLPLILGLASFKKFLGFMALVIPGVIAFLKFYKPMAHNYQPPIYSDTGPVYPHYKQGAVNQGFPADHHSNYHENPVGFENTYNDDGATYGQDLAYQGYGTYKNA